MTGPSPAPETVEPAVRLDGLTVGDLLAEGGEGRVFELPLQPHLVVKCYRRPSPRQFLDDLVAWPNRISDPGLVQRVRAATAWPTATVIDVAPPGSTAAPLGSTAAPPGSTAAPPGSTAAPPGSTAAPPGSTAAPPVGAGVLLPRAPRRFALRHRDGTTRLATLSYLTADPAHRAVAYGLSLPEPVSPERLGLVYALARVLEAFDAGTPSVGHGDLSTKNVLWSLQRGPEVFVLDCDNCDRFDPDGRPLAPVGRRRAMTPNWDDPAVAAGANPTLESDRYSLALIFLRVVGAANFPIQAHQRQAHLDQAHQVHQAHQAHQAQHRPITVDFAVPPGRFGEVLLGPGAPLWELCERGLGVSDPSQRPPASAWVAALEAVLDALGAAAIMRSVWAAQGGGVPSPAPVLRRPGSPPEVEIRPVLASPRPAPRWTLVPPMAAVGPVDPWHRLAPVGAVPAALGLVGAGIGATPPGGARRPATAGQSAFGATPAAPVRAQARAYLVQAAAWWAALHRQTARALWASGHRGAGFRHLAVCVLVDLAVALVGLFVVAMIVAPVLGI